MAILGYNTSGGTQFFADTGRKIASKWTLASTQTLSELHAYVAGGPAASNRVILHIHSDSSGVPGTRVAYTSPITIAQSSALAERSQSGFSTSLAAGDYWLGITFENDNGYVPYDAGVACRANLSGSTFDPPSDPFGTASFSVSRSISVWAVVDTPATTFVPTIAIIG